MYGNLAMTSEAIDQHSEGNGPGENAKGKGDQREAEGPTSTDQQRRMLLIEDNPGDAFLVQKLLSRGSIPAFNVIHAETRNRARELVTPEMPIEVILLDLNLPDSTGETTFRKIQADFPGVPVVILTGLSEKNLAHRLLSEGAYGFVRKDEMTESTLFNSVYSCIMRHEVETELDEKRRRAERFERDKTDFLAKMSHELRTPLAAIIGFTEQIKKAATLPHAISGYLDRITSNAKDLQRFLTDTLDVSKAEAGQLSIIPQTVDLPQFLDDVLASLAVRAKNKTVTLRACSARPLPRRITTDPARLKQVLNNVVGNAVKFTGTGTVNLRLDYLKKPPGEAHSSQLSFTVEDQGPGIADDVVDHLFTIYGGSRVHQGKGSGLGLALAKGLAEHLGGDLSLKDTGPDGSTFEIRVDPGESAKGADTVSYRWPMAPVSEAQSKTPEASSPSKRLAGVRVLMIEDSPDIQLLNQMILESHGATVDPVEYGQDGIDRMVRDGYHAILLDLSLPDIDGDKVAANLRDQGIQTGIVVLTGHALADSRNRILAAGCDEYLTKPATEERLVSTLRQVIDRKGPHPEGNRK